MTTPAPRLSRLLHDTFADHLDIICSRTTRALAACGHDALLVHSGSPLTIFEDDQSYPFKVHAPFKVWTPLSAPDCFVYFEPGRTPLLLAHRPVDFWHRPLEIPESWWTGGFEIRASASTSYVKSFCPQGKDSARTGITAATATKRPITNGVRHSTRTPSELLSTGTA